MTTYYVDSAAGSNTSPYDTWAKAATKLATIAAIDAAGDNVYVASTHNESNSGGSSNVTLNWAGTLASPTVIISSDKTSGAPPSTATAGATLNATGVITTAAGGSGLLAYYYGLTFISSATTNATNITCNQNGWFDTCSFQLSGASGSGTISPSNASVWKNCTVKFGATGQTLTSLGAGFFWEGGGAAAGGTTPTNLVNSIGISAPRAQLLDFSSFTSGFNLLSGGQGWTCRFRKCKMPTGWSTASACSTTMAYGSYIELIHATDDSVNYAYYRETSWGSVAHDTTVVRNGGATDGTQQLSWKMVRATAGNTSYPLAAVIGGELELWCDNTGSRTVTVYLAHDQAAIAKNDQVWIEVRYAVDSGDPLGAEASSAKADVLASGSDLTADTSDWDDGATTRANSTLYATGVVLKTSSNPGRVFLVTTGGTTSGSEPGGYATAVDGTQITDGTATVRALFRCSIAVNFTQQIKGPVYVTPFFAGGGNTMWLDRRPVLT